MNISFKSNENMKFKAPYIGVVERPGAKKFELRPSSLETLPEAGQISPIAAAELAPDKVQISRKPEKKALSGVEKFFVILGIIETGLLLYFVKLMKRSPKLL